MADLKGKHFALVAKTVSKMDIKDDLKNFYNKYIDDFNNIKDKTVAEKKGMEVVIDIIFDLFLSKYDKAEKEIMTLLEIKNDKEPGYFEEAGIEEMFPALKELIKDKGFKKALSLIAKR